MRPRRDRPPALRSPQFPGRASPEIASAQLGDGVFYQVIVAMSEETIDALLTSGACLYGFKAVAAWDKAALPLVWLKTSATHSAPRFGGKSDTRPSPHRRRRSRQVHPIQ